MKKSTLICLVLYSWLNISHALGQTSGSTEKIFSGPVLGHTTDQQISIWFYTEPNSKVEIHYSDEKKNTNKIRFVAAPQITAPSLKKKGRPYKATITKLKANTTYKYKVTIDGKSSDKLTGKFKTAPEANKSTKFRIAISSCIASGHHKAWNILQQVNPDFHLLLGDTAYADRTSPDRQWSKHLQTRKWQPLDETYRNISHYSVWDDHDYGRNNADGSLEGKEDSLATWKQLWCNPEMGLKNSPGVFYKFSWADVDFFVLDGRYHRSKPKAPNDDKKTMLGDDQFNWLVKSLKESNAKFKVLATGSTWITKDSWKPYPRARKRLLEAIETNKISGVVYLSGDLHRCVIKEHRKLSYPLSYPFVELTSSGISNSKKKRDRNFMTIEFDTTLKDPTIKASIFGSDMEGNKVVGKEKTWKLSELSIK